MEADNIKEKYNNLKEKLEKYNEHYYVKNESLVTDTEYDMLLKEVEKVKKKGGDGGATVSYYYGKMC